jgi:hypothetical protein
VPLAEGDDLFHFELQEDMPLVVVVVVEEGMPSAKEEVREEDRTWMEAVEGTREVVDTPIVP